VPGTISTVSNLSAGSGATSAIPNAFLLFITIAIAKIFGM
jgi:hypothetical protein